MLMETKNFPQTAADTIPFDGSPHPFRCDDPGAQHAIRRRIEDRKNDKPRMNCLPAFAHLGEFPGAREASCFWKIQAQTKPFTAEIWNGLRLGVTRVVNLHALRQETFAATLTAASEDRAAVFRFHAGTKTELAFTGAFGRLITGFHGGGSVWKVERSRENRLSKRGVKAKMVRR